MPPRNKMDDTPSKLALENAAELASLKAGHAAIHEDLVGFKDWMLKMESTFKSFSDEVRTSMFSQNRRNPALMVASAMLGVALLGIASGLTIFTIHSELTPVKEAVTGNGVMITEMRAQERHNFELIIRHDERIRLLKKK